MAMERYNTAWANDTTLQLEFLDTIINRSSIYKHPIKRLQFAVLSDAYWNLKHARVRWTPAHRREHSQALDWIYSRESDYAFSFEGICESLGFDPERTRAGILKEIGHETGTSKALTR